MLVSKESWSASRSSIACLNPLNSGSLSSGSSLDISPFENASTIQENAFRALYKVVSLNDGSFSRSSVSRQVFLLVLGFRFYFH